jgi:uroporphyrin-III C-methyltransferase/precorrin-2 dehydrogenase/sirohydrochlorin ferrochelatase/uroporphyrin-III C-methyltransferase
MSVADAPLIHLIGAGPGDPDLLTVKALRLLQGAEVVVYDRLVSPAILELVPTAATRIYVGKARGRHTQPQDEINALLVKLARSGHKVLRLKGGDPFIFGRGSEEAEHLARHGIAFEVVPGVTAASGCAAGFGIPLTHRGLANGVRFVTGHCRDGQALELNWHSLADPDTTLVIYMGLASLPTISRRLIAAGLPPDTPAAAIAGGTMPHQTLCRGTLANLPARAATRALKAPVLIVVGQVVALAAVLGTLAWDPEQAVCQERQARHA